MKRLRGLLLALLAALSGCKEPGWIIMTGFDSFTSPQPYDTSGCMDVLNAAAVCMRSEKADKAANLRTMEAMAERVMADHPDTDVIVFPELCTGWLLDPADPAAYFASVAEPIPGPSTTFVAGVASRLGVSLVFGLAEVEGGRYYNSQAMLQPDGTLVKYRKRGLNQGDKENGCLAGNGVVNAAVRGIPVTFLICSDYQSEAVIRDLSTGPAPVVLASLVTATRLNPEVDFLARSLSRWVVFSNGGGSQGSLDFPGFAFTADPTGTVHDAATGPGAYSWTRIGVWR